MKYLIIHGEGFADGSQSALGGKSLLETARTPHMDRLARVGEFGWVTIPVEGGAPRAELTGLSLLGYDPKKYSTGPAPLEAVGLGIAVGEHDIVYRAQFVSLRAEHAASGKQAGLDVKKLSPAAVLDDASAGGLETEEARELIEALNESLGSEAIQFYLGSRHQHYLVWVNGKYRSTCVDPLVVQGHPVGEFLPAGDGADLLRRLMDASVLLLRDHPVNLDRHEAGRAAASCVWLWGQGRSPQWPLLSERYGLSGAMLSTSMLHRGLGRCAGFDSVDLEDVRSGVHSVDAIRKGALHELSRKDVVCVHTDLRALVEEPASVTEQVPALEVFDREVVGPLVEAVQKTGPSRVLLVCDHSEDPAMPRDVSYQALAAVADPAAAERDAAATFSEAYATSAGGPVRDGVKLLGRLLRK